MDNFLIKFKNQLRKLRKELDDLIKKNNEELDSLDKLIAELKSENNLPWGERLLKSLHEKFDFKNAKNKFNFIELKRVRLFCPKGKSVEGLVAKSKKGDKQALQDLSVIYDEFSQYINNCIDTVKRLQYFINAYENDKIKAPICDVSGLFEQLFCVKLTIEEVSRIMGMTIVFNSKYAKKNKNHDINNIDVIRELACYYNDDGTFKYTENSVNFEELMKKLLSDVDSSCENQVDDLIIYSRMSLVDLKVTSDDIKPSCNNVLRGESGKYLPVLNKYYRKGEIVGIPEDLAEFYFELDQSDLVPNEKDYIRRMLKDKLEERRKQSRLSCLSEYDRSVYENALKLLNSLDKTDSNVNKLMENIQLLHATLEQQETSSNVIETLEKITSIISVLSSICYKYKVIDDKSTNRYIFLLDKNYEPYIFKDIQEIGVGYSEEFVSLLLRVVPEKESHFKPHFNYDGYDYKYKMFWLASSNIYVSFVEIDIGIYVIMGTSLRRNDFDRVNNRLKNHENSIKEFKAAIADPCKRDQVLAFYESYLKEISGMSKRKFSFGKKRIRFRADDKKNKS